MQDEPSQQSVAGSCGTSSQNNNGHYNAFIQNTYDTNKLTLPSTTDYPIGKLTQSISTTYFSGSAASVTESYEHDARGRSIGESVQFSLPSSWNVTTALPTYQEQLTYNDADQLTTTTTSTVPTGQGFTTTVAYDSTGSLYGLSNNSSSTPNLATLTYNARAQLNTINFQTTSGGALAAEQFMYDANLRTTSATGTWGANSGQNGTIYSENLSYDAASNVISLSQTQNAVGSNAGGSETSNFCYNEQNQMVWAGNSGTQPGAGNGTCGSGTLSSGLTGASYSNSYVYTHLGQLYQAPLNGSGTQEQYLYCGSSTSAPHQLVGLYPVSSGATCSNYTGKTADYSSSYDAFGNVTSRTTAGVIDTLSYDPLDQLTKWSSNATGQTQLEQYVYDATGNRVLRRSTSGPSSSPATIMTVYAFGLEEHSYTGSGTNQGNIYYYSLAGRLIGSKDANGTVFYMTDMLGSVLASFTNTPNTATLKGNQVYGPYGNSRYSQGTINTFKGFTGQYNDSLTGLYYYNARYYDPVAGVFLSADVKQGNMQGMNPYAYVSGNPETHNDPTGLIRVPVTGGGGVTLVADEAYVYHYVTSDRLGSSGLPALLEMYLYDHQNWILAESYAQNQMHSTTTLLLGEEAFMLLRKSHVNWNANNHMRLLYLILDGLALKVTEAVAGLGVEGSPLATMEELERVMGESARALGDKNATVDNNGNVVGGPCSFTATTPVATNRGERAIGTLHVGDKVWAYNTKTHKMELEPVLHVWINHDNDLVDVTLSTTSHATHSRVVIQTKEVIHTNKKHPFLTLEKGFLAVGQFTLGMHVLRADGTYGIVTGWKIVPGAKTMYNLEVKQDHTFTVGIGQWIVHNSSGSTCDYSGPYDSNFAGANRDYLGTAGGFGDDSLIRHFEDHGAEMGFKDPAAYERSAIKFMSGSPDSDTLQLTRPDSGYTVRWNTKTGQFGIVDDIGNLVTYYDISGQADPYQYFVNQFGE